MDQETLTNHIVNLSKALFDIACQIVLTDVFDINAINVDGVNDGGTDFIGVTSSGKRTPIAYQVTVQKKKVPNKVERDTKKTIEKLQVKEFFFFTSTNISETNARKLERDLKNDLGIPVTCYGAKHIAGFLIEDSLINKFLDKTNYPLPRSFAQSPDYKEMALYGYTVISDDARGMKETVYDDTILFLLSDHAELTEQELIEKVIEFLGIENNKFIFIKNRLGALFSKSRIKHTELNKITLTSEVIDDVCARKRLYEAELADLAAAQIDIMRSDFKKDWTIENSKEVGIYIADCYIAKQFQLLNDIGSNIIINGLFRDGKRSEEEIKDYICEKTKLPKLESSDATSKLIENASNHPLITKLARASVYVALEGLDPVKTAKALGVSRWNEFDILIEPSVAIPWICSQLYQGFVNSSFDISKKSIIRAQKLGSKLYIPYYYINECASHLVYARSYVNIDSTGFEDELCYSPNAYIANYFSLKKQNVRVPETLLDYLKTFSSSIQVERHDYKDWVRSVMTDIQSLLTRSGVEFIQIPFYESGNCSYFQTEYVYSLEQKNKKKPKSLIDHDVWALQFTHDEVKDKQKHWAILTFDRSMVDVAKKSEYSGWVITPDRYLDLTTATQSLTESQYSSLVHSLASSSEKTLSMGARIIDKVVNFASNKMQNWEFKQEFDLFKKRLLSSVDFDSSIEMQEIDSQIDKFLTQHGISHEPSQQVEDFS
jgi:uncharacterized protein (UPF0147 family)